MTDDVEPKAPDDNPLQPELTISIQLMSLSSMANILTELFSTVQKGETTPPEFKESADNLQCG